MKKILTKIHIWASIPVGIFFSLLCLTGAILVYANEYREWVNLDKYFVENVKSKPLELSEIVKLAQLQLPDSIKLTDVSISTNKSKNYSFSIQNVRKGAVYIDQYTGKIKAIELGTTPDVMSTIMRLHRWLLMPMKRDEFNIGKFITGWVTLISVFILITGIIIWIPKNLKYLKKQLTIKTRKGAYRFWHDFHLVAGILSVTFLLALCLTGLTWSFSWYRTAFYKTFGVEIKQYQSQAKSESKTSSAINSEHKETKDYDFKKYNIWQTVVDELNDKRKNAETITISDQGASVINKGINFRMADKYSFNKETGKITKVNLFKDNATKQQKVQLWIMDIHFGNWAGWFSKLLTFLVALIGAALPISGYYIWLKKKIQKCK